jgi:hypothetical protein
MADKLLAVSPSGQFSVIHDLGTSPKQALDSATVDGDTIFYVWGGSGGSELDSIPRAGGTPKVVYQGRPQTVATDASSVYFVDSFRIMRVAKAGGAPTVLATRPDQAIFQLTVAGDTLYWAEYPSCPNSPLTTTFWTVPAAGGTAAPFAPTVAPELTVSQFVVAGGKLVFTIGSVNSFQFFDETTSGLYQLASGGQPELLVPTAVSPLAFDGEQIYYATIGGSSRVGRIAAGGGAPVALPTPTVQPPSALAVSADAVTYLGRDTCLYSIAKTP